MREVIAVWAQNHAGAVLAWSVQWPRIEECIQEPAEASRLTEVDKWPLREQRWLPSAPATDCRFMRKDYIRSDKYYVLEIQKKYKCCTSSIATQESWGYRSTWSWRIPTALQDIPSIIQLPPLLFCPESPRWLVSKGRDAQALNVLVYYHADGNE